MVFEKSYRFWTEKFFAEKKIIDLTKQNHLTTARDKIIHQNHWNQIWKNIKNEWKELRMNWNSRKYYLRVLGSPNLGLSFVWGQWDPEAACFLKSHFFSVFSICRNAWILAASGTPWIWVQVAALSYRFWNS